MMDNDQAAAIARGSLATPYPNLVLAYLVDAHPRLVARAMIEVGLAEAPELELVDEPEAELAVAVGQALGHGAPGSGRASLAYNRFFRWLDDRRQAAAEHGPSCICPDCTSQRLELIGPRLERQT